MEIILVAAMAMNRAIGLHGRLPWHIPEELELFKEFTLGYPMIMGRKTFESLPGILPKRSHIVLSRNENYKPKGVVTVLSMKEALDFCVGSERVSIIGGEQIFREGMKVATKIRLTMLERNFAGDTFFPPIYPGQFEVISKQTFKHASEPFVIVTYIRT